MSRLGIKKRVFFQSMRSDSLDSRISSLTLSFRHLWSLPHLSVLGAVFVLVPLFPG